MVAALIAAMHGKRVMLVEKTDKVGGTTAYSSGTAWIPGTHLADSMLSPQQAKAEAAQYLDWMTGTGEGRELRDAFLESGREVISFLQSRTDVKFFLPPSGPDYRVGPGSATRGRALVVQELDGRLLGSDFALLREPREGFDVFGGMMVARADLMALLSPLSSLGHLWHVVRILARHARDRLSWPRGTRLVMGNALVGRLLLELRKHQVKLVTQVRPLELLHEGDGITGARLSRHDGSILEVRAELGVVIATGGFSASAGWRQQLMPRGVTPLSVAAPGNSGDGLTLAAASGAAVESAGHRSGAFWMPTSTLDRGAKPPLHFPHIVLDRAKPGLIAVNSQGRRFVNEAGSYHDFVSAMFDTPGMGPDSTAWLICDRRFLWHYGLGLVRPWDPLPGRHVRRGYLRTGRTVAALAAAIGVAADALGQTVERHNAFAAAGIDTDFGRGSTPLNTQNGDPSNKPNPCLAPIVQAPFYALAVRAADLATSSGIRVDVDARALDATGRPIKGLYAVGNDMASIMRGTYPGPGTTLGPAIVFAWRAMRHALGPGMAPSTNNGEHS